MDGSGPDMGVDWGDGPVGIGNGPGCGCILGGLGLLVGGYLGIKAGLKIYEPLFPGYDPSGCKFLFGAAGFVAGVAATAGVYYAVYSIHEHMEDKKIQKQRELERMKSERRIAENSGLEKSSESK